MRRRAIESPKVGVAEHDASSEPVGAVSGRPAIVNNIILIMILMIIMIIMIIMIMNSNSSCTYYVYMYVCIYIYIQ